MMINLKGSSGGNGNEYERIALKIMLAISD
jgi:hypothetical protein